MNYKPIILRALATILPYIIMRIAFKIEGSVIIFFLLADIILLHFVHASLLYISRTINFFLFSLTVWSYYIEGSYFGPGFFYHLNLDNLLMLGLFKKEITLNLISFFIVLFSSYFNLNLFKFKILARLFVVIACFLFVFVSTPLNALIVKATMENEEANKHLNYDEALNFIKSVNLNEEDIFPTTIVAKLKVPVNVVIIYLESFDFDYIDNVEFISLTPFLQNLKKKSVLFKNFKQGQGGWTAAGLFSTQCGHPISIISKDNQDGNDILSYTTTRPFVCLGDLFNSLGYKNIFIQGTDLSFAGTINIFREHRFDKMYIPIPLHSHSTSSLFNPIHDEYIFESILKELINHDKKEPAFINGITFGTHAPGFISPLCEKNINFIKTDKILKAVQCTDYLLNRFFSKYHENTYNKNTIFFILSDHIAMNRFNDIAPSERRNTLLIYNPLSEAAQHIEETIYHYDFPKILLNTLNMESTSFPLSHDPSTEKSRFINYDQHLIESIRSLYNRRSKMRLECNSKIKFDPKYATLVGRDFSLIFSKKGEAIRINDLNNHFIYVEIDDDGYITEKLYLSESQTKFRLVNSKAQKVLIIGILKYLKATLPSHELGYYWGKPDLSGKTYNINSANHQIALECHD